MGWLKIQKTWISWKWNLSFSQNKKILILCLRWHIFRSSHFLAKVTFILWPELRNYQPFYATQGTTWLWILYKKGLKFKSRTDLHFTYHNDENEIQNCWIEILNKKEPNTIIGVYYRHPKKNSKDIFNIQLDGAIKKYKPCVCYFL